VQAAGGNTSIKDIGRLWVKASGTWLADAIDRDIFVPVDLDAVLDGIAAGRIDPVGPAVLSGLAPPDLRPSIETSLHALLPHRVVVHTHSVRTIALAVREDAEALLAERLVGLDWHFVPYCHPGPPLARAVAARLRQRPADVLVLGNHGLVVGGETVEAARHALAEVERRLDSPLRAVPTARGPNLPDLAASLGLRPALHAEVHGLARDPLALPWITQGSLYPDHVIFLGPAASELPGRSAAASEREAALDLARARGSKLFILPGEGVLLEADAGRSAEELALCLALVVERIPEDAPVRHLTAEDEAALMNWDAEKYRQALARAREA
jgi:rhamnose utilization protein RhaD (predicted bifunctional aldolase and dehydrogenase)